MNHAEKGTRSNEEDLWAAMAGLQRVFMSADLGNGLCLHKISEPHCHIHLINKADKPVLCFSPVQTVDSHHQIILVKQAQLNSYKSLYLCTCKNDICQQLNRISKVMNDSCDSVVPQEIGKDAAFASNTKRMFTLRYLCKLGCTIICLFALRLASKPAHCLPPKRRTTSWS